MSTYNGERYIHEQIDSILNQKGVEVSLLVRDDGSTDSTRDILNEYKNNNENVKWYSGTNLGCGRSFYQLIMDAPLSEYYAFADQDDVWDYDKLSIAISKISNYADKIPSLYCSSAKPVDEYLNVLPQRKLFAIKLTFGIALTQAIAPGCTYVFNNMLIEKFKKLGINNVDIHDWAILRVVTAVGGYVYYDTVPHICYRQHGNNVIGYQNSFIDHWKGRVKRFCNRDYRKIRHEMALKIKDVYYNDMTNNEKLIINLFVNYKLNINNKIKLLQSRDIKMVKKTDNLIFKILVLFSLV